MILEKRIDKIKGMLGLGIQLAKANLKLRNEGSYIGVFWYLLEPLSFFIVLLFLNNVIGNNTLPNYPLYLLLGLIMFNFFISVTNSSAGIIGANAGFIKSIKIHKESFVLSSLIQFIFSHIMEILLFTIVMIYLGANPGYILFYPLILFFFILFTLGFSFIIATIGVYFVDFSNIWLVFGRLLWFVTPIFYYVGNNSFLSNIIYFNPIYHFLNISREIIIYNNIPSLRGMIFLGLTSLLVIIIGIYIFEKNKDNFAEKF